jgi:DNA-directed RNA polymerase specialized sigma24 family protein
LKEEERIAIVLCYSCGMSHSEASEATGMPLGTVKSHVNRGRAKMQAFFNEAEETVS